MGIFDRVRESTAADRDEDSARDTASTADAGKRPEESGELTDAGSSLDNAEAATGGADAVPDTPDAVEENYT